LVRRNRHDLPYRPVPEDLSKRRRMAPDYANFYGSYETKLGKWKRFSFKVKVDPNKNRIVLYKLIKHTCSLLKRKLIPKVPNGHVFDDFGDCLHGVDWMKVRSLHDYRAGMRYAR
jgi:hypothetical protein